MKKIDLVVNRIRMDMVKKGDMMSIEDVVDILSIDLIGAVPDDENIDFKYDGKYVMFKTRTLKIFDMYKIEF